jgi:hypothetical protein
MLLVTFIMYKELMLSGSYEERERNENNGRMLELE